MVISVLFRLEMTSINTSGFLISTFQSPMPAGETPDVIERLLGQLFYHTNTGGFLLLLEEVQQQLSLHLELLKPPMETTNKKQGKDEEQILIGQEQEVDTGEQKMKITREF